MSSLEIIFSVVIFNSFVIIVIAVAVIDTVAVAAAAVFMLRRSTE
jgi:hypothetical protein